MRQFLDAVKHISTILKKKLGRKHAQKFTPKAADYGELPCHEIIKQVYIDDGWKQNHAVQCAHADGEIP